MEMQAQNKRGGARDGAGRKKTGIKRVSFCFSGTPEQIEKIKQLAKENGMNTSQFILSKLGIR